MVSAQMNPLQEYTTPDFEALERRALAERHADLAGIKKNPWTGANDALKKARAEQQKVNEQRAADAFGRAVSAYRDFLQQEAALIEQQAEPQRRVDRLSDALLIANRLTLFFNSGQGKDWRLERMATRQSVPPGFTQSDLDQVEAYKAARNDLNTATSQLSAVQVQLKSLEEQYPVLSDLRK